MSALLTPFRSPDLRKKILITLSLLALYRLGTVIPLPGVSYTAVQTCIKSVSGNTVYDMLNLFGGGALLKLSVLSLGIMPFITASIIMQLLTVVIPRLASLKKEGQSGQATITQYTRYLTAGLALLQATTIIVLARNPGTLFQGCNEQIVPNHSLTSLATMMVVMVAGAILVMWFGEIITDRGIGNGMSLLIFTSIAASMPSQYFGVYAAKGTLMFGIVLAVSILVILVVVYVEQAQRRIPLQYTRRTIGAITQKSTTYLPFKVNMAGVVPVIFASSLMFIPQLFINLTGSQGNVAQWISRNFSNGTEPLYLLAYIGLIIFFAFFYVAITFNPIETADNLKISGGFIPGIRPGKPTADYLDYVLTRLTFPGSFYLAIIAAVPIIMFGSLGLGQSFLFGGTSLLILVSVGLDTVKQVNSQVEQRNYEGFLK